MPGPIADLALTTLELTVSINDLTAEGVVDASHCHFHTKPMFGCFNCESGAVLNFSCATDFGFAIATIDCGNIIFSARCNSSWIEQEIILTLNEPTTHLQCMAHCPASSSALIIEGTLVPGSLPLDITYDHVTNIQTNSTSPFILPYLQYGFEKIKNILTNAWTLIPQFIQYYPFLILALLPLFVVLLFPFSSMFLFPMFKLFRVIFRL